MMTNLFKYTLLIFLLSFSACSSEDYVAPTVPNGQPQPGDVLELTVSAADFVTDGAPDTRATDNDNETTFENGDRVGIIILDKRNVPIYNNIPYKYNGGKWVFDSNNGEGKGACYYDPEATTYIVYYPYSQTADGVTNENDLKSKFAPKLDQSAKENYRASDLMYCKTTSGTPFKRLEAKLKHAYASVSFAPTAYRLDDEKNTRCNIKVSDVSLTIGDNVYIPYKTTDGSLRSILPASFTTGSIRCFYVFGGKNCGNTIKITVVRANTRYTFAPEIINKTYSLKDAKIGDFYCRRSNDNNGYLIPSDFALTNDQKNNCVGVVFWVGSEASDQDPLLKSKRPDCTHGLVVALQDATLNGRINMNWSNNKYTEVQNWVNSADNPYKDKVNLQETEKMCGYSNTLALKAYNEEKGDGDGLRVLPCDAIQQYSKKIPAPTNSSGWYFPSIQELKFVCWGQGEGQGITGRNNLNTYIRQVGGITFDNGGYWSSTESDKLYAWYVGFDNSKVGVLLKIFNAFRVRPLLAF